MANVITDSNGNVLTVNGGAFTVDASVDANITAGNIKKNVSILGVTGTYDGHTAGNLENDVNFRDYDGTILYSYTAAEFADLSALPANPTHSGLVALGWNWSLAGAKTYVARHGGLEIGQMYVTDDGKTRLYVETVIDSFPAEVRIKQTMSGGVSLDWGDGSAAETQSGTGNKTFTHTYTSAGQYVITLTAVSGTFTLNSDGFGSTANTRSIARKIETGMGFYGFESGSINENNNLETITMSNNIQDSKISTFSYTPIKYLVVPSSCKKVYTGFNWSRIITALSLSEGLLECSIDYGQGIRELYIPDSVTYLKASNLSGLKKIHYTAANLTSVPASMFIQDNILDNVSFPQNITTFNGDGVCGEMHALKEVTLPSGLTSIPASCFFRCLCLKSITIPSTVTSIGTGAFSFCRSLTEITIPVLVTSIGNDVFKDCVSLMNFYFLPTTPPTFGNSTVINRNLAIIHVPHGCLEAYQAAYPNRASQMVEMPANE